MWRRLISHPKLHLVLLHGVSWTMQYSFMTQVASCRSCCINACRLIKTARGSRNPGQTGHCIYGGDEWEMKEEGEEVNEAHNMFPCLFRCGKEMQLPLFKILVFKISSWTDVKWHFFAPGILIRIYHLCLEKYYYLWH